MNEGLQDESEQQTLPEPPSHHTDALQQKEPIKIVGPAQNSKNALMRGANHSMSLMKTSPSPGGSAKAAKTSSKKKSKYQAANKSLATNHINNLISDQDNHDHQLIHQMSCGMNAQPDLLTNEESNHFFDESSPNRRIQNSSTVVCSSSVDFGHTYQNVTSLQRAQSSTVCTGAKILSGIGEGGTKAQNDKFKPQQYILATSLNQNQSLLQSNNNEQYFLFSTEENPIAQNQSKISFGQVHSPQQPDRKPHDTIAHYFLDENEMKGHEHEEHYEKEFEHYRHPQNASNISRSDSDSNLISNPNKISNSPNGVVVLHSNYLLLNNDEDQSDLIDEEKIHKEDNEAHSQSCYLQTQNNDQQNLLSSSQPFQRHLGEYFIDKNDEDDDGELNQQEECIKIKNPLDQSIQYIPPNLLQSQASSHSTVFAEEDHHIQSSIIKVLKQQTTHQDDPTKSYTSLLYQKQNFQALPSNNLTYHSMDIPSNEKKSSSRRRAQLQTALMNSNLFIDDSKEYDQNDDDEQEEQQKSIFEGLHIHQPGDQIQVFGPASLLFNNDLINEAQHIENEEQKSRYFLQDPLLYLPSTIQPESVRACNEENKASFMSHDKEDQEAVLLMRGRTSVLEEVEDDDLVNQNSSKSSSRSQSQNRNHPIEPFTTNVLNQILQREEEVVLEHQSQQNFMNGVLHHQMLEIEEEIKSEVAPITVSNLQRTASQQQPIQNTQQNVPLSIHKSPSVSSKSSKKRSTRGKTGSESGQNHAHTRFTYFAASGLSDDRWLCPICLDIFEDAVETPCCHNLFCEACIKRTPTCPLCNMRINPLDGLKPNIPIRRLVLELSVSCPNDDCDNIIRKGEIDKHMKVCPYTLVDCPNTSEGDACGKILRKNIERHKIEECPFRIVECLLKCELMLPLNDMEDHIANDCPKTIITCKNKCGGLIERGDMDKHINVDCPFEIVDCPNKGDSLFEEGCQARLKRKEMESHKVTCNYRKVHCPNQKCNAIIVYKDLPSHDERCLFKIVECENKCGHRIQRQHIDRHRDQCEFQLVKCPYFDHGCKIEVLRKEYVDHLKEEGFAHSILFIEGQKRKNREIDELKNDLMNMRQNYDVEIQAMFMEMNRVKEDLILIKNKTGISSTANNHHSQRSGQVPSNTDIHTGPKMILGVNSGIGGGVGLINNIKRDERRYGDMPVNSSAGSSLGGFFEHIPQNIYRGLEQRGFIMSGSQAKQQNQNQEYRLNASVAQTQQFRVGNNQRTGNNNNMSNNSGSLDSLMQSIGGSSFNQNMISSMQYTSNTFGQQSQINPFTGQPSSNNNNRAVQISNTTTQPSNTIFASSNPFFTQNAGVPQHRRPGNGGMQDAESDDGVNTSSVLTRNVGGGGNTLGMFSFRGGQQNNQLHSSSHLLILGEQQNSSQHSNSLENLPNNSNAVVQQLSSQINAVNNNNNQTFNFNGCNRSQHSSSQFQLFGENTSRTRAPLVSQNTQQQIQPNSLANGPSAAVRQRRPDNTEQERKQSQMALFLGSIDSSQESNNQQNRQQQQLTSALLGQSYKNSSPTGSSLDFWQLSSQNNGIPRVADTIINSNISGDQASKQIMVSGRQNNNTTNMLQASMKMLSVVPSQSSNNFGSQSLSGAPCGDAGSEPQFRPSVASITQSLRQQQSNISGAARGGAGGSGSIGVGQRQQLLTVNNNNNNVNQQEDLDSSNVLYDDDFEIEEESKNNNNF